MAEEILSRTGEAISTDDESQILDAITKWLDRDVKDNVLALDHADEYPHEMVAQMKSLGLFGATISRAYGGLGLPSSTYAKIVAIISEVWMSLTGIFNSHLIMAAAVERFGTEEQKQRFLPRFATGEIRGGLHLLSLTVALIYRRFVPGLCEMVTVMSSMAVKPGSQMA